MNPIDGQSASPHRHCHTMATEVFSSPPCRLQVQTPGSKRAFLAFPIAKLPAACKAAASRCGMLPSAELLQRAQRLLSGEKNRVGLSLTERFRKPSRFSKHKDSWRHGRLIPRQRLRTLQHRFRWEESTWTILRSPTRSSDLKSMLLCPDCPYKE